MGRKEKSEIRICHVADDLHEDLKNIAKNSGITMVQLLKPKLREIANSYPEEMRKPPSKD